MSIKIAVIGSKKFMERILPVASEVPNIDIDPYFYQEPQKAAELINNIKPCDVIFFSGALPYYFSKHLVDKLPIPSLYLTMDELAVASSFLSIVDVKKIALDRISIDLLDSSIAANVLAESELSRQPIHILDYRQMLENDFDLEIIVTYHHTLWKQGEIELALTSVHAVYDRLDSLGVPVMRMTDPKISLIRGLQNAKAQAELKKRRAAQVAIGYISAPAHQEPIHELAHEIQASVQKVKEAMFILYSTRGKIEALIEHNILNSFLDKWQGRVTIGFGYGATITEADQNAKVAFRFAEKEEDRTCFYILTEEKELVGPFPHKGNQHRLKNDHPEILQVAKQTKLSPANISKLIEFSKSRPSLHFTATDLAEYLQITRRSTERIIKKLVDQGYVKIVGEEMTYQQGRPRSVYQLNIPVYL